MDGKSDDVATTTEAQRHDEIVAALEERFAGAIQAVDRSYGDLDVLVERGVVHDVLAHLKGERAFDLLSDVAGVDRLQLPEPGDRFEVVYILYATTTDTRMRVRITVPEDDMRVPTASDLWRSANWAEREAFEMFGFDFTGHPCLTRLLTHHEFKGYPLRKDYPVMGGQWCTTTSDLTDELNE